MVTLHRQAGVTLIELMVAIAILVVGLTLAIPAFTGVSERATLKGIAEEHLGVLAEVRQAAISQNTEVTANFAALPLPDGVTVTSDTLDSDDGEGTVRIDPRSGLLTDDSDSGARVLSIGAYQLQVNITRMGRGSICAPAGDANAALGYPSC